MSPPAVARGSSIIVALIYIGAVYATPRSRRGRRNDPVVVRHRMISASLATVLLVLTARQWLPSIVDQGLKFSIVDCTRTILYTTVLFVGPLLQSAINGFGKVDSSAQCLRNLVVGPLTEELVYRLVIGAIYKWAGISPFRTVLENPLYFAFAHFHHALELVAFGHSFWAVVRITVFHFLVTSLFGVYAAYLFVRTGSVWPPALAHMLCNYMGPPVAGGPPWYRFLLLSGLMLFIALIPKL